LLAKVHPVHLLQVASIARANLHLAGDVAVAVVVMVVVLVVVAV
jgi:hypothetical protein